MLDRFLKQKNNGFISKTVMKNKPDAKQSIRKGLSDIGGLRPNLTQPSQIAIQGNPTKPGGEDVLSMTTHLEKIFFRNISLLLS